MTDVAAGREQASETGDMTSHKPVRRGSAIHALKQRDNHTNFIYLAFVYAIIIATIAATVWSFADIEAGGLSWWWHVPVAALAIIVIGASQHQLGGAIHEGTHYMLFDDRKLNELASDWLAAFPIYTSTFNFRLHHLAHHQFINDPERDPDFAQLKDSGHWLDFPITHVEMLWVLLKLLWLPNLIRYTLTRARYSALGTVRNPYVDAKRAGKRAPTLVGIAFAGGAPVALLPLLSHGYGWTAVGLVGAATALAVLYYWYLDERSYPTTHLKPVISHRATSIGRVSFMGLLYGALTAVEAAGMGPAWAYFGLLWIVPLFTTFPLFMIMRQWVQHGNADRGRYTNTRVFLVSPLLRYAVFPFGMDYHLPHHLYASVPHYRLKDLHDLLLTDPEYREKGTIVEGYLTSPYGAAEHRNPTVLEVLGSEWAPQQGEATYVDNEAIADAEVENRAAIRREAELSRRSH